MTYIKPIIASLTVFGLACSVVSQTGPVIIESSGSSEISSTSLSAVTNDVSAMTDGVSVMTEPVTTMTDNVSVTANSVTELTGTVSVTTEPVTEAIIPADEYTTGIMAETTTAAEPVIQGVICGEMLQGVDYIEYQLPDNPDYRGFKSYEPYDLITAQSVQLRLQEKAVTDVNGFRLLDGRYLVAVGTFCNAPCGTYIDLILENGTLIPCIVGDIKSDAHTDETHTYTLATMCASEFLVDDSICPAVEYGDVSMVYEEWRGKVTGVRVYHVNIIGFIF